MSPTQQPDLPQDPPAELDFAEAGRLAGALRDQVGKAFLGQEQVVDDVVAAFLAGGHVLLEGVPGLGKTLLVLALARAIGGSFSRVQFTPDLMPSDVTGHTLLDQQSGVFRVRRGPVFANLLLADEINRAPAKTQSALLEVMQEQQVTIEGQSYPLAPPFMTLATQNPIEQEGTYPLPEAQLDRFLLKVRIAHPPESVEVDIVRAVTEGRVGQKLEVDAVRAVMDPAIAQALQRCAARVTVDDRVVGYAVRLVRATRSWQGLAHGRWTARGALVRAARGVALLEERDFVTPDDIKGVALAALRHRVSVAPELEVEGLTADDVIRSILEAVEAPRQ